MKTYTIIRSDDQYRQYQQDYERLNAEFKAGASNELRDIIDTIQLLIDHYEDQNPQLKIDPIQLIKSLIQEHHISQNNLADLLQVSKGHLSDILNYKKPLSRKIIRMLSYKFKIDQEELSKPYKLRL